MQFRYDSVIANTECLMIL